MIAGDLTTLANVKAWLNVSTVNDDALLNRLITSASQFIQAVINRVFAVSSGTEIRNGTGTAMMALGDYPVISVSSVKIGSTDILPSPDGVSAGFVFDSRMLYLIGYIFPMGIQNVRISYTHGYQKTKEAATIPAAVAYTIAVTSLLSPWAGDISVNFVSGSVALVKVASSPTTGQYSCTSTAGVWTYTFAAADASKAIEITYMFTPPEIEQACIELISLRYREKSRIGENSKSIGGETVSYNVKDMPDSVRTILNEYRRVISVY